MTSQKAQVKASRSFSIAQPREIESRNSPMLVLASPVPASVPEEYLLWQSTDLRSIFRTCIPDYSPLDKALMATSSVPFVFTSILPISVLGKNGGLAATKREKSIAKSFFCCCHQARSSMEGYSKELGEKDD